MNKYEQAKFELDNEKMFNIINNNAEQKIQEAYLMSQSQNKIKGRKKEKNKLPIKQAIAVILATTALLGTIKITNTLTQKNINNNNVVISIEQADSIIDDKINSYDKLMNMYADRDNTIELVMGRNLNTPTYEPLVYYDETNLAKHIVETAKISETETRCAIIAAFKIINEPYRNETINTALEKAHKIQVSQEESYNYKIPENSKEFLEQLGYQDWDEYKMNERKNIKENYAIEQYVSKGKGL